MAKTWKRNLKLSCVSFYEIYIFVTIFCKERITINILCVLIIFSKEMFNNSAGNSYSKRAFWNFSFLKPLSRDKLYIVGWKFFMKPLYIGGGGGFKLTSYSAWDTLVFQVIIMSRKHYGTHDIFCWKFTYYLIKPSWLKRDPKAPTRENTVIAYVKITEVNFISSVAFIVIHFFS